MEHIILATISSLGITLMMLKFLGLRTMLEFEAVIDIAWTVGLAYLYHSTFSGMTLGLLTGVFVSIQLWILRSVFPNKKMKQ